MYGIVYTTGTRFNRDFPSLENGQISFSVPLVARILIYLHYCTLLREQTRFRWTRLANLTRGTNLHAYPYQRET